MPVSKCDEMRDMYAAVAMEDAQLIQEAADARFRVAYTELPDEKARDAAEKVGYMVRPDHIA